MNASTQELPGSPAQERLGIAKLTRRAFEGQNLAPIASNLLISLARNPTNAAALMDLSVIEQLNGNLDGGLDYQSAALATCQLFRTPSRAEAKLRLLVLAAPIHMGGNTPTEFLLENSNVSLTTLYIVPGMPLPDPLPDHDVAFVAAPGDCDHTRAFLLEIERHLAGWPRRVLNLPGLITRLERDLLYNALADVPGLIVPATTRCNRAILGAIGHGNIPINDVLATSAFPLLVRPVGSHAGRNLEKLMGPEDIEAYLATCLDTEFFISRFIDYRSDDGLFRKYRIVFVAGRPFACHMAIADQWDIWYLNADMENCSSKRAEEERFMTCFDGEIGTRHKQALGRIAQHVKLEYFGIDCAETRDGQLVMFEADNALIVHDMDSPDVFPYKKPQMHKIFAAFEAMLHAAV